MIMMMATIPNDARIRLQLDFPSQGLSCRIREQS